MQCLLTRCMMRFRVSSMLPKLELDVVFFCVEESDEKRYPIFIKYFPFRLRFPWIPACTKEVFQPEKLGVSFPPKLW